MKNKVVVKVKRKIKKGDQVMIITGKDKGSKGVVKAVITKTERLVIEGLNISKKHVKPQQDQPGGIEDKEMPIHISNVMLVDTNGKPTRVGRRLENGKLVKYYKTTGEIVK